jgi:hypothetical protein
MQTPQLNLVLAWLWICLGFVSGLALGLFFHQENWLGGYGSFKRRLYRLAHISFFGLGMVNLCFYFTVRALGVTGPALALPAWAFIAGAISMPVCCVAMAHFPRTLPLFAVPVLSLLLGGILTLLAILRTESSKPAAQVQTLTPFYSARFYQSPSVSICG